MVALVSAETVLLVLLLVLVAGLLRSHAELLRRVGAAATPDLAPELVRPGQAPLRARAAGEPAPAVSGTSLAGDPVVLAFDGVASAPTLLAFLTSGCASCLTFWETLAERPVPGVQTVIVTRGPEREQPAKLRALARPGTAVVMSGHAWAEYSVPGAPYFVLVDGAIRGEGVATTVSALVSLVADAIADAAPGRKPARAERVDDALAAAGIRPGDPSLYPGRSLAADE